MGNAFADYLRSIGAPAESEGKQRRKYESKEPTETLPFGDDAELAVWVSTSKRGNTTVRWNVRRRDDEGRLLSTMKAESLPDVIVSLISFCRKLSDAEEYVSDKVRTKFKFLCDHLDSLEFATLEANGEANQPNALFGKAE